MLKELGAIQNLNCVPKNSLNVVRLLWPAPAKTSGTFGVDVAKEVTDNPKTGLRPIHELDSRVDTRRRTGHISPDHPHLKHTDSLSAKEEARFRRPHVIVPPNAFSDSVVETS